VGSGSTNAAPGELLRAAGSGSEDARVPAWTRAPPGTRLTTAVVEVESSLGRRLRPDDGEAKIFFFFSFDAKCLYETFFDFTKMFVFKNSFVKNVFKKLFICFCFKSSAKCFVKRFFPKIFKNFFRIFLSKTFC
jgi:hypothetical protein